MSRGGARNRSGPQPDPNSLKSDKIGRKFERLPIGGYSGEVPEFPLPDPSQRELDLWGWAWRQPQAAAWVRESWRWDAVALWVRYRVRMEQDEASAALANVVVRYADQIGMTPAGLKENGWIIGAEDVDEERPKQASGSGQARARLKVV